LPHSPIIQKQQDHSKKSTNYYQKQQKSHFQKAYPIYPHRQLKAIDFAGEKQKAQKAKKLFEDPEFPPEAAIQFHPLAEWRRPYRIVEKPVFFSTSVSRHDIQQTGLGLFFGQEKWESFEVFW
jgi:hypothetical protein